MRYILFSVVFIVAACQNKQSEADAFGNFEAEERLVSAESSGKIMEWTVEEGQRLEAGQIVGRLDSTQVVLR